MNRLLGHAIWVGQMTDKPQVMLHMKLNTRVGATGAGDTEELSQTPSGPGL
jgi:hypothetical protein